MKTKHLILLAAALLLPATAQAQWWGRPWYGGNFASTAAEGYARGMADITRSAGMANLLNAQAAVVGEQAYSAALDNQLKATETYYNKKAVRQAYMDSIKKPPLTSEQAASLARMRAPAPLTTGDYDPVSGEIAWPAVLRDDQYSRFRQPLDELFVKKAQNGGVVEIAQLNQILDLTSGLTTALKAQIKAYRPNDYLRARNFVESLAYEAQLN